MKLQKLLTELLTFFMRIGASFGTSLKTKTPANEHLQGLVRFDSESCELTGTELEPFIGRFEAIESIER